MTARTVSVVLPTYNGSRTVVRAIRSVAAQLRAGDELVVVNDASTDTTAEEVGGALSDMTIGNGRLITRPDNGGPAATRNTGLAAALGDVIMSIDHDDEWAPGHLSVLLEALDPAEIAVGLQSFRVDSAAESDAGRKWWKEEWLTEPQEAFVFGGAAVKRACFERIGMLDQALRFGCDDVDWFARAQLLGVQMESVPDVVLLREIHDRNLSAHPAYHRELLTVVRRHAKRRSDEH